MVVVVGWPLLQAVCPNAQPKAESQVRMLKEELKLEKDVWMSTTTLLAWAGVRQREQDN